MRIRKNAKISALLYTNTKYSNAGDECLLQKNLCQLNQSPWDIITFPSSDSSSSFYQLDDNEVYYNVNHAGNGSSIDPIGDFERFGDSVASKTSGLGDNNNVNGENLGFKEEVDTIKIQEDFKLCGKIDEKGWQCGSVVTNNNTMCDYHLSEVQNCAVWTTMKNSKKVSGSKLGPTTGCRPCRAKKRPTTSPHDFYYYSGFGPSWGKKRGTVSTVSSGINSDMDVQEEKGKRLEPEMSEVGCMELDYIDNDVCEKGQMGIYGKRRGRKPVKERSLKSLM